MKTIGTTVCFFVLLLSVFAGAIYADTNSFTGKLDYSMFRMNKAEVFSKIGMPTKAFTENGVDIWYYAQISQYPDKHPLVAIYVLFEDGKVVGVRAGHPNFSQYHGT